MIIEIRLLKLVKIIDGFLQSQKLAVKILTIISQGQRREHGWLVAMTAFHVRIST